MIDYAQQPDKWEWLPFFSIKEFSDKATHECCMNPEFMQRLYEMRSDPRWKNKPMVVTSGYRSPARNAAVGGVEDSAHTKGLGCDISCTSQDAYLIMKLAFEYGFTGIGVSQSGAKRFVHLDTSKDPPRPNVWSYKPV